jgi:hypothetical protein
MPDKMMDSPAPSSQTGPERGGTLRDEGDVFRPRNARRDDGLTNPRDGRGPLRPRDDQAAKLPLRPPH